MEVRYYVAQGWFETKRTHDARHLDNATIRDDTEKEDTKTCKLNVSLHTQTHTPLDLHSTRWHWRRYPAAL
jgi:hypothetical protein